MLEKIQVNDISGYLHFTDYMQPPTVREKTEFYFFAPELVIHTSDQDAKLSALSFLHSLEAYDVKIFTAAAEIKSKILTNGLRGQLLYKLPEIIKKCFLNWNMNKTGKAANIIYVGTY